MSTPPAEVAIDAGLVAALLREQHPDLAGRTIVRVASGWDNDIFRLGDDLVVRLPRREITSTLITNELRWLPALGPDLPLAVPIPIATGSPGCGYPWPWSIARWVPGHTAEHTPPTDPTEVLMTPPGVVPGDGRWHWAWRWPTAMTE